MKNLTRWISNLSFPILIILLTSFIAWVNYEPGTFLSGWDTLHSEFNLSLYLKRSLFGVWQEHQGVGAVASQAHAAELPKILIFYLLNLFLPLNLVRYSFFFLCLGFGSLGVYFLAKYLLNQNSKFTLTASFLASIFYIFNLTTVQQFYVPLEMFAVAYALLPWLFFMIAVYLKEGKRKHLLSFAIVSIFSASMAHTATLFFVYLGGLVLFFLTLNVIVLNKDIFKKSLIIIFLTLFLNAYWLLPNLYYIRNHAKEVTSSKIHSIFSDEAFLQSKSFGDFENLALSKNFLFNWREYDFEKNTFVDLMDEWIKHLGKPHVREIGLAAFVIVVLGILASIATKNPYILSFLPVTLVCVFFWINANPPFEGFFNYLRENYDLFREGLRFPFTKFSILMIMIFSVYFAYASALIMKILSKLYLNFVYFILVIGALVYFALPIAKGYLISPSMKVKIPDSYFEIFKWFEKADKSGRIAKLPFQTFWGWNFYSWGYQGAGFTWFGIPQPTFDREFDRWSSFNESFYSEAAFALYANDNKAFERVLRKYQVKYLLLDESVINAGGSSDLLFIPEIKGLIATSSHIKKEAQFNFLTVYKTDFDYSDKFISAPSFYTKIDADLNYSQIDPIYSKYGNYIQDLEGITYPFVNFDKRGGLEIFLENDSVRIVSKPLVFSGKKTLSIPEPKLGEVFVNPDKRLEVRFAKEKAIEANFDALSSVQNCDIKKLGSVFMKKLETGVSYKAEGGGVACASLVFPDLSYGEGYILRVKGKNKEGRSLKIYLQNNKTKRMDLEELLPVGDFDEYFFVLPRQTGYTLNLETRSFGRIASENVIEDIEFYPVDYDFLSEVYIGEGDQTIVNKLKIKNVEKMGTWLYKVEIEGQGLLVLGQGYEPGWVALSNFQLLKHVKVNSWANGWIIDSTEYRVQSTKLKIIIFFWPQILEYVGFFLTCVSFYLILKTWQPVYPKRVLP